MTNPGLEVPKRNRDYSKALILSFLALVAITLVTATIYRLVNPDPKTTFSDVKEERVAVRFQDYAGLPDKPQLTDMASHWITNRLGEVPGANVVNYSDALNEPNVPVAVASLDERRDFASRTKAINVLEGAIYRRGDELWYEAQFVNLETGETLERFDVIKCPVADPMQGIDRLARQVKGWWASKEDNVYSIPTYEAYQLYLDARQAWSIGNRREAGPFLRKSIEADETFIDPYFQ